MKVLQSTIKSIYLLLVHLESGWSCDEEHSLCINTACPRGGISSCRSSEHPCWSADAWYSMHPGISTLDTQHSVQLLHRVNHKSQDTVLAADTRIVYTMYLWLSFFPDNASDTWNQDGRHQSIYSGREAGHSGVVPQEEKHKDDEITYGCTRCLWRSCNCFILVIF